jgi:intracellular sulfur oxidation DsrE/DsrF family protein
MSFLGRFSLPALVVLFFTAVAWAAPPAADPQGQHASATTVYFDVNVGEARKLAVRLQLINTTYEQLAERGVAPHFVVGFRGAASFFTTKGDGYVEARDLPIKKKIHDWLQIFAAKGIRLEQCRIAADLNGINATDFRPEVAVVANGYVEMISYQHQGYAYVPMD